MVPSTAATKEPVLPDLEVTVVNKEITNPSRIAALPSGEAAVVNDGSQVLKINNTGHTVKILYDCDLCYNINGLLFLGNNLYVVHNNGTIAEIQPHTGELLNVYHIPDVEYILHEGSLSSDPPNIPNNDILLLPDLFKGEVFSYNLTSGNKQVHVTGLSEPTSVSYMFSDGSTYYIVCQHQSNNITKYDSSWKFVSSFSVIEPYSVVLSSNNSIIVVEHISKSIYVFTSEGEFLHYLSTDKTPSPQYISYFKPYLWVTHFFTSTWSYGLYRYWLDY